MATLTTLQDVIDRLQREYGRPDPPEIIDPFHMMLWESVAYLVDDNRRAAAFQALRERVGLEPEQILAAPEELLVKVASIGGIHPERRASRLREAAQMVVENYDSDLSTVLSEPSARAKRALQAFPAIGEPGAEKILLYGRKVPVLALESNGLRVMVRLGFGKESENYATSYRSVRTTVVDQLPDDYDWLIAAHQLLRRHGQQTCRRSSPVCSLCPLADRCHFARGMAGTFGG